MGGGEGSPVIEVPHLGVMMAPEQIVSADEEREMWCNNYQY